MFSKSELFDALQTLTPNQRTSYEIRLAGTTIGAAILSSIVVGGLSTLLAQRLVTSDLSSDALISIVILPGIMSFLFVAAAYYRKSQPGMSKKRAMVKAGWQGMRAGFVVGLVVVMIIHFLGQLLLARAIYGPFTYRSEITAYCRPLPILYGALFAVPVALGAGLFTMYLEVSAQIVYEWVASRRFTRW